MKYAKLRKIGTSTVLLISVFLLMSFLEELLGWLALWLFISLITGFLFGLYLLKEIGWYEREILTFVIMLLLGISVHGLYLYLGILTHLILFTSGLIYGYLLEKYQPVGIGGWDIVALGIFGMIGLEVGLIILTLGESLLKALEVSPSSASPIISSITLGLLFGFLFIWYRRVLKTGRSEDEENWEWGKIISR